MLAQAIIVVFVTVIIYAYGMRMMGNIDHWVKSEKKELKEKNRLECAIVFGEKELTKNIVLFLRKREIQVIEIREIGFQKEWGTVEYFLAVSTSDLDNLSICNLGKKFYQPKGMLGICNQEENRALYRQAGIELIQTENIIYQIERMTERKAWGLNED